MSHGTTAWDAAALRVSSLYVNDDVPLHGHVSTQKKLYGTRALPLRLGVNDERSQGGEQALSASERRLQRDEGPFPIASTVLYGDKLPEQNVFCASSDLVSTYTLAHRLRRQVVGGSLERRSPYWHTREDNYSSKPTSVHPRIDGPQRARIAMVGAELERHAATAQRRSLLRHGSIASEVSHNHSQNPASTEVPSRSPPQFSSTLHQLLPRKLVWTQEQEEALRQGNFGWAFSAAHDARIPSSDLLSALHYYTSRFYATRGLEFQAPTVVHDGDMVAGSDLWRFWARHSLGWARPMTARLDGKALVALATLVKEYAQGALGPRPQRRRRTSTKALAQALRKEMRRSKARRTRRRDPAEQRAREEAAAAIAHTHGVPLNAHSLTPGGDAACEDHMASREPTGTWWISRLWA